MFQIRFCESICSTCSKGEQKEIIDIVTNS